MGGLCSQHNPNLCAYWYQLLRFQDNNTEVRVPLAHATVRCCHRISTGPRRVLLRGQVRMKVAADIECSHVTLLVRRSGCQPVIFLFMGTLKNCLQGLLILFPIVQIINLASVNPKVPQVFSRLPRAANWFHYPSCLLHPGLSTVARHTR